MPRVKRKPTAPAIPKMPKGFYLKRGIWYKRVFKPDPNTGVWALGAESTHCQKEDRQGAIDYISKRNEELQQSLRLRKSTDPGKITVNQLFDDLLAGIPHDATRVNYQYLLTSHLRPFFGHLLAANVTLGDCQAYRAHRRKHGIADTTINRDLSKSARHSRSA